MAINVNEDGVIKNVAVPSMPYAKFMFNLYQDGYNTPRKMGMDESYVKAIASYPTTLPRSYFQEFLTYKLDFCPKFMTIKPIHSIVSDVIETDVDSRINAMYRGTYDASYYIDTRWIFMTNGADIVGRSINDPNTIAAYYAVDLYQNHIRPTSSSTRKGCMFYTFKLDGDLLRCYGVLGRAASDASINDTYLLDNYFFTMKASNVKSSTTCYEVEAFN
jgi:hypothetical protein